MRRAALLLALLAAGLAPAAGRVPPPCRADDDCREEAALCFNTGVGRDGTCACPAGQAPDRLTALCAPAPAAGVVRDEAPRPLPGALNLFFPPLWACAGGQCWAEGGPGPDLRVWRQADVEAVLAGGAPAPAWVQWRCPGGRPATLRAPDEGEAQREFADYCLPPAETLGADPARPPPAPASAADPGAALFWPLHGGPALPACALGAWGGGPGGACVPGPGRCLPERGLLVAGAAGEAHPARGAWCVDRLELRAGGLEAVRLGGSPPDASGLVAREGLLVRCAGEAGTAPPERPEGPLALLCGGRGPRAAKAGGAEARGVRPAEHAPVPPTCAHGRPVARVRQASVGCGEDGLGCQWDRALVDFCDCRAGYFGADCSQTTAECAAQRCGGRGACTLYTRGCRCVPPAAGEGCASLDCGPHGVPGPGARPCDCLPGWTGPACREPACGLHGDPAPDEAGGCVCRGHALPSPGGRCEGQHACGPTGWLDADSLCRCEPGAFLGGPGCLDDPEKPATKQVPAAARASAVAEEPGPPPPVAAAWVWVPLVAGLLAGAVLVEVAIRGPSPVRGRARSHT